MTQPLDGMILSKDSKSHHCIKQETAVIRLQVGMDSWHNSRKNYIVKCLLITCVSELKPQTRCCVMTYKLSKLCDIYICNQTLLHSSNLVDSIV